MEPFLSISSRHGDLKITTEHGINPEKIDKGCLIFNAFEKTGYYVLTFDRAGAHSRFWLRDFLGVRLITDDAVLTNQYADLAVSFLQSGDASGGEPAGEDVARQTVAAKRAMNYFDTKDQFSMQEFEEEVLRKDPEMVARFKEHKARFEEEAGLPLKETFGISRTGVAKVKKKVGGVMKFDTGVEVRLLPRFPGIRPRTRVRRQAGHGFRENLLPRTPRRGALLTGARAPPHGSRRRACRAKAARTSCRVNPACPAGSFSKHKSALPGSLGG